MNRAPVRTAAAVLAAAVTLSGLKGITVLAEVDSRPAGRPVVVLPSVVVAPSAQDTAPRVAAGTNSAAIQAAISF